MAYNTWGFIVIFWGAQLEMLRDYFLLLAQGLHPVMLEGPYGTIGFNPGSVAPRQCPAHCAITQALTILLMTALSV